MSIVIKNITVQIVSNCGGALAASHTDLRGHSADVELIFPVVGVSPTKEVIHSNQKEFEQNKQPQRTMANNKTSSTNNHNPKYKDFIFFSSFGVLKGYLPWGDNNNKRNVFIQAFRGNYKTQ